MSLFYLFKLYIQWDQFIIAQVTLPTLSHQVPSNFMLVFKSLYLNLLNIVNFLTLKFVIGYHHTRLKTILTIFKSNFSMSILTEKRIFLSQISVHFQNNLSQLIHRRFGKISINRLKLMAIKGLVEGLPENIPELEELCPICLMTKATTIPIVTNHWFIEIWPWDHA